MTTDQKAVVKGALSGIIGMLALVVLLYVVLPTPEDIDTLVGRLAYALRVNAVAAAPLFIMLATIGNRRFLGGGIDPLATDENASFEVDIRVATNTLEQNFVFFVSSLALAASLAPGHIHLIGALGITFVLARVLFWAGYRKHYLYRAPGMAATYYLNLLTLIAALYLFVL